MNLEERGQSSQNIDDKRGREGGVAWGQSRQEKRRPFYFRLLTPSLHTLTCQCLSFLTPFPLFILRSLFNCVYIHHHTTTSSEEEARQEIELSLPPRFIPLCYISVNNDRQTGSHTPYHPPSHLFIILVSTGNHSSIDTNPHDTSQLAIKHDPPSRTSLRLPHC